MSQHNIVQRHLNELQAGTGQGEPLGAQLARSDTQPVTALHWGAGTGHLCTHLSTSPTHKATCTHRQQNWIAPGCLDTPMFWCECQKEHTNLSFWPSAHLQAHLWASQWSQTALQQPWAGTMTLLTERQGPDTVQSPGTSGGLAKLRYPRVVSAARGAQPKKMAPKTAWHHCLLWHALNIIYPLTYICIKYIQSAHWHTVFYTFYESYPTTCLCLPGDWNPITALLRTSLRGLKNRDSACLLQNKICCNFWGWCKTLAAVQNNKQYIFYNGSTKIARSISFLGLLVLLFCFKITGEEKHGSFWVPSIQYLLLTYLFI